MKNIPNAMKFGTQSRSSSLIINVIFEIWQSEQNEHLNYENINWNWWPWPKILHLKQIEHVDYELIMNSNWWSWPKIIDLGKFGPNTEICSDFYEIWHSQQIKHTYYEYNTCHCLERSHDYRLRMIVGSKHGTITRTIIVAIIVPCSEWL